MVLCYQNHYCKYSSQEQTLLLSLLYCHVQAGPVNNSIQKGPMVHIRSRSRGKANTWSHQKTNLDPSDLYTPPHLYSFQLKLISQADANGIQPLLYTCNRNNASQKSGVIKVDYCRFLVSFFHQVECYVVKYGHLTTEFTRQLHYHNYMYLSHILWSFLLNLSSFCILKQISVHYVILE